MSFYWLTLGVLAVWRITHLFAHEDGPFNLIARLREAAGTGILGSIFDCFYCLSLWVSAPISLVLGHGALEQAMLWLACSGAAILLERLTGEPSPPTPIYLEEKEIDHELLRKPAAAEPHSAPTRIHDQSISTVP
jgi:hypothetical protein